VRHAGPSSKARSVFSSAARRARRGIWNGEGWTAHAGDVAALTLVMVVFTALSAKVFRWE
jgi:hypothetical protein